MVFRLVKEYAFPLNFHQPEFQRPLTSFRNAYQYHWLQCMRTGKQCVYIQSCRGRRLKNSTSDSTSTLRAGFAATGATAASTTAVSQPDLDADLCADLLIDDNDAVFDSLFFNASYPFTPSLDFLIESENLQNLGVLRQYQCDHDM